MKRASSRSAHFIWCRRAVRTATYGRRASGAALITDALCYSTTDIFAAGFRDNAIGKILGVDENTGAGGANVWEYPLIADLMRRRGEIPPKLPGKASFRFAVRRVTRIGKASGLPLEDLGVIPNELHEFTRDDVLKRNVDLINHAARMLAAMPRQRLTTTLNGEAVDVRGENIRRVDVYLDDRPLHSRKVRSGAFRLDMAAPRRSARELRVEGFRGNDLVAATRIVLPPRR